MTTTFHFHISMELLSQRSGMGISTINKKIRQRYGEAPIQYLQRIRAEVSLHGSLALHPTIYQP